MLRAEIQDALGDDALAIEHVGSTSVPGLLAKPILDICLTVQDPAAEGRYVPTLGTAGYELRIREPAWHEHRMLWHAHPSSHLHVFPAGCAEVGRMVRFRDRLRSDPTSLERYARAKQELASRHWCDGQDYADAKSTIIEEILAGTV